MIEIELRGFEEAERALRALPLHVERRALIDGLRAGARVLVRGMKRRVPERTGKLRDSIVIRTRGRNRVVIGFRRPDGAHAHLVEFGTAPHRIRARNARVLRIGPIVLGRHVDHPGARPKPFIRPTLDEDSGEAIEAMRVRLGRIVERIALELAGQARARFTRPRRVNPTGRSA